MFWNKYPYTNFHELNLDWILARMKELNKEWDEFTAVNKITNAGAWDITKQYQAWTIVSDNNAGYISLQAVPAGVAITNTDYWGLIADYDILITDLSNRISALENTVGDASSGLVKDVNDLENTVGDASSGLVKDVSLLKNHKYVFLGDSYNFWGGGWLSGVVSALDLDASDYYDETVSGHGFTVTGATWLGDITNFVTNNPDVVNDITDVVIVGGINDCVDSALGSLGIAVNSFCNYVKANLPNAHVTMCFVGNCQYGSTYASTHPYKNKMNAINYIQRAILSNGGSFPEGCPNALYSYTLFSADGLHPNNYGNELGIIPAVVSGLKGNDFNPRYVYENGSELDNGGVQETIQDGYCTLRLGVLKIDESITIDGTWKDVSTLSNQISGVHHEAVECQVQKLTNPSEIYHCFVRVRGGVLQMRMADTVNQNTFKTFTSNQLTIIDSAVMTDPIQNSV